jgi:hypothetical protein
MLRELDSPTPLPVPTGAVALEAGTPTVLQPTGAPIYASFGEVDGWFGENGSLTFTATSSAPFNLGIYGPNPPELTGTYGRMRAPALNTDPDSASNRCQGNYVTGTYYLVFRSGPNGAPTEPITITIVQSEWNVFTPEPKS